MNITRLTQSLLHSTRLSATGLISGLLVPILTLGLSQSAAAGRVDHAKVLRVQPIYISNRHQQECWPDNSRYDSHRGSISIINGVIGGTGYSLQINPGTSRYDHNDRYYSDRNDSRYNTYNNTHNNHDDRFKFNKHSFNNSGKHYQERYGYQQPHHYHRDQRDCTPRHGTHHRQKLVGYDVIYKYHGRTYRTRTPYHPGKHLRVSERGLPI